MVSLSTDFILKAVKVDRCSCCPALCTGGGGVVNFRAILSLLHIPAVLYVVVLRTLIGIPMGVLQSMFTVVNMERFNLTPESNGRVLSFSGIIVMVRPAWSHTVRPSPSPPPIASSISWFGEELALARHNDHWCSSLSS